MNYAISERTNYTPYLPRDQKEDSKKLVAIALATVLAVGAVIGTFFLCGIDSSLMMETINSTEFYILAGVAILFVLATTGCVKNLLSDKDSFRRDFSHSYRET